MVNLICDFIGHFAKSDSKSGKEREGERQLWRRQLTFSFIQIDNLFVQKGTRLNGNCIVFQKHRLILTFCSRCFILKREIVASDRRINPTAVSQNLLFSAKQICFELFCTYAVNTLIKYLSKPVFSCQLINFGIS